MSAGTNVFLISFKLLVQKCLLILLIPRIAVFCFCHNVWLVHCKKWFLQFLQFQMRDEKLKIKKMKLKMKKKLEMKMKMKLEFKLKFELLVSGKFLSLLVHFYLCLYFIGAPLFLLLCIVSFCLSLSWSVLLAFRLSLLLSLSLFLFKKCFPPWGKVSCFLVVVVMFWETCMWPRSWWPIPW